MSRTKVQLDVVVRPMAGTWALVGAVVFVVGQMDSGADPRGEAGPGAPPELRAETLWVLALAEAEAPTPEKPADVRPLTDAEKKNVETTIAFIEAMGESGEASVLREKLDKGQIKVTDTGDNTVDGATIIVTAQGVGTPAGESAIFMKFRNPTDPAGYLQPGGPANCTTRLG